jgi:hypothetical protein
MPESRFSSARGDGGPARHCKAEPRARVFRKRHIEVGETPEECAVREVKEASVDATFVRALDDSVLVPPKKASRKLGGCRSRSCDQTAG